MKLIEKHRHVFVFSILVGTTAFVAGCGSADEEPRAPNDAMGTSGASTAGGSSATGGSAGTGTTGGSAGAGTATGGRSWSDPPGSSTARDCTASDTATAPADGLIASFMGEDVGIELDELVALPPDNAPTFGTEDGALHITANIPATAMPQYPNVILGFGGCLDASAFSGVEFSLSGSISGCTMQYASADVAHQDVTSGAPFATGPAGSYQPQHTITAAELTAEPQTLEMPFAGGPTRGRPATPLDPAKLTFLLWQFTINPADGSDTAPCSVDVTIDDVKFY